MTSLDECLRGLFYVLFVWRIGSYFYTSYWVSETLLPRSTGCGGKVLITVSLMASACLLTFLPISEFPRLCLMNRILSIPSQLNTIYFMHGYLAPAIDSSRVTVLCWVVTFLSVIETVYLIQHYWNIIDYS